LKRSEGLAGGLGKGLTEGLAKGLTEGLGKGLTEGLAKGLAEGGSSSAPQGAFSALQFAVGSWKLMSTVSPSSSMITPVDARILSPKLLAPENQQLMIVKTSSEAMK
jgi:hypothetical protein